MDKVLGVRSDAIVTIGEGKGVVHVDQQYRFAFEMKNAARVLANKTKDTSDPDCFEMKALVIGAVSLSYSYLEAAFNEFIHLNASSKESPLTETEKAVINAIGSEQLRPGNAHVLRLFNMVLRLLCKQEMKESEYPYQAANLVRKLRNSLVHPTPGRVVTYTEDEDYDISTQQSIVKQLRSYLSLGRHATFPWDVLTTDCAVWSIRSCEDFFHEFSKRTGVDPGFITK